MGVLTRTKKWKLLRRSITAVKKLFKAVEVKADELPVATPCRLVMVTLQETSNKESMEQMRAPKMLILYTTEDTLRFTDW